MTLFVHDKGIKYDKDRNQKSRKKVKEKLGLERKIPRTRDLSPKREIELLRTPKLISKS